MRAVWSYWSKPYKTHRSSAWASDLHHLLSWVLSVETARQHYTDTALITDDQGARMLVDGLGLSFSEVSTELNALRDHDPAWWSIGKIYAYRLQTKPFLHIDSDVYLWKRLSSLLESADVLAQNEEIFQDDEYRYYPGEFERETHATPGTWIPREWLWYRSSGRPQRGFCCGIVGGNRVDFLSYYAAVSIHLMEHPPNRLCWLRLRHICSCLLFEQYLLSACVEYHRQQPGSPFPDIRVECLFENASVAYQPERAAAAGYTHLLADAKRDERLGRRLKQRVMREYPSYYDRCVRHVESQSL
jgi:hypothetical protein